MKQYPYLLRILSFFLLAGLIPIAHTQNHNAEATKHENARFSEPYASFLKPAASGPAGVVCRSDPITRVAPSNRGAFQTIRQDRNDSNGDLRSWRTLFEVAKENNRVHEPEDFGFLEFVD
tara:strand:- start:950 stop:1309 length:360 start_codon:yes stop_codon:yes gene_type:complete